MNKKVSYPRLLAKFDSFFNKGYNTEDRQFLARIKKDKKMECFDTPQQTVVSYFIQTHLITHSR